MVFPERPGSWPHGAKPAQKVFARIIREIAASEKVYVAVNERSRSAARELLPESYRIMRLQAQNALGS